MLIIQSKPLKYVKILRDDMVRAADADPLDLFRQSIRSEETRHRYTRTLRQILCEVFEDVLEDTFEARAAQLVRLGRDDPGGRATCCSAWRASCRSAPNSPETTKNTSTLSRSCST